VSGVELDDADPGIRKGARNVSLCVEFAWTGEFGGVRQGNDGARQTGGKTRTGARKWKTGKKWTISKKLRSAEQVHIRQLLHDALQPCACCMVQELRKRR
jgi:hypothetical protein